MRANTWISVPALAALAIACAHDRGTNAPPQTETTGSPVEPPYETTPRSSTPPSAAPAPVPAPGTDMQRNTTGTDESPGSSTWGTSGPSGAPRGAGPEYVRDGGY
jgi:hypothetical protein